MRGNERIFFDNSASVENWIKVENVECLKHEKKMMKILKMPQVVKMFECYER